MQVETTPRYSDDNSKAAGGADGGLTTRRRSRSTDETVYSSDGDVDASATTSQHLHRRSSSGRASKLSRSSASRATVVVDSSTATAASKKKRSKKAFAKTTSRGSRGSFARSDDMKAKLERSRQSARECRARKKLRYQYLEELVAHREQSVLVLRQELETYKQWCKEIDEGRIPEELMKKMAETDGEDIKTEQENNADDQEEEEEEDENSTTSDPIKE